MYTMNASTTTNTDDASTAAITSSSSTLPSTSYERRKILLIGDSITQQSFSLVHQGWGAGLADWYQRTGDVINRGYSGYNSRWICQSLAHILPEGISREEYMLVTIFLGANDAAVCIGEEKNEEKDEERGAEKTDGETDTPNPPRKDEPLSAEDSTKRGQSSSQYVPLQEYRINIVTIIMHVKKTCPNAAIVLITPPVVDNLRWPNRTIPRVSQYAQVIRDIGKEQHVLVLDLWSRNDSSGSYGSSESGGDEDDSDNEGSSDGVGDGSSHVAVDTSLPIPPPSSSSSSSSSSGSSIKYVSISSLLPAPSSSSSSRRRHRATPIQLTDLHDGLHLGVTGNLKVLLGLQALIRTHCPAIVPEDKAIDVPNLALHLPHWSAMVKAGNEEQTSRQLLEQWHW